MTEDEWTEQKWWYAGLRAGQSAKVLEVFVGEDGQEHYFKKGREATRFIVGHAYMVPVTENGNSARLAKARLLDEPKHKDTVTWNMEEMAFKTVQSEKNVVKRLQEDNEFEEILDRLQGAYKRMRTSQDKGALLGYITARITYRSKGET